MSILGTHVYPSKPNHLKPNRDMDEHEARKLLHVSADATVEKIEKACKFLSKKHHPDKGGSIETFVRFQQAKDTLIAKLLKEADDKKKKDGVLDDFNDLLGVIPVASDFNDPSVIAMCRNIENEADKDDGVRRIYEVMRAYPGYAWPSVWPPAEVLTPNESSDGAGTSGVPSVLAEQENERKRKRSSCREATNLKSHNNPGKKPETPGHTKRPRGRPRKNTEWNECKGVYEKIQGKGPNPEPHYKRRRGANPKGKKWNYTAGGWINK